MKFYTEDQLKSKISRKYHKMIDWKSTMFKGFDGTIVLNDFGQVTTLLPISLYETISNLNWYLKQIEEDPEIEW